MTTENATMKSMPPEHRPYELCRQYGPGILSDAQLLAVILRCGSAGERVEELARRLLEAPETGGLAGLFHMSVRQLTALRGIGPVKAVQLQCIGELSKRISRQKISEGVSFHDPRSIASYYMEEYRHEEQEKVLLIMLSSSGSLIADQVVAIGTVNAALISPREIFVTALKFRAVSIVLLHNHPSGDPSPSREDMEITRRISESGQMLGITLLDHIIIGDQKSSSFKQLGLL